MANQLNQGRISVDFMKGSGQPPLGGPKIGRHKSVETGGGEGGGEKFRQEVRERMSFLLHYGATEQ